MDYKQPSHGLFRFIPDAWVPYASVTQYPVAAGVQNTGSGSHLRSCKEIRLHGCDGTAWDGPHSAARNPTIEVLIQSDIYGKSRSYYVVPVERPEAGLAIQAHQFGAHGLFLFIYPLLKRYTDFPQVKLGFGLSYAIFLVIAIIGKDPLAPLLDPSTGLSGLREATASPAAQSAACLCAAGIVWSVFFDTIYAHQDYVDDQTAGVKGLAVRLGRKRAKPALYMMTAVQVFCLVLAGRLAGFSMPYYTISCGGAALLLAWMIWIVKLEDGSSCAWAFGRGSGYVGASVASGLFAEFWSRKHGF
ncbi:4-hydroxybenzoate polyprenyl transferase [Nemania diffusa]|nr:4-hydroxybenzoate polyprenyl transferase [Nemania diffusa]